MPKYRVIRTVELMTSYYVDVLDELGIQELADMDPAYDGLDCQPTEYLYENDVVDSYTHAIYEVKPDFDPKKSFFENDGKQVYHHGRGVLDD